MTIDERDVRIDTYVGGAQWTITMTHLPTGIRVTRSGEGSKHRAKRELLTELAKAVEKLDEA